ASRSLHQNLPHGSPAPGYVLSTATRTHFAEVRSMSTRSKLLTSLSTLPLIAAGCAGQAGDSGANEPSPPATEIARAEESLSLGLSNVPNANTKAPGFSSSTVLSPELIQT